MRHSLFILSALSIVGFASLVGAQQFNIEQPLPTEVNVEIQPEVPGPNELVHVYLTSYSTNIDAAKISWFVDGKVKTSGFGEKRFSFSTGEANTATSLEIVVETKEGETINKTYKIKPTSVDLVWQANGYTPPFYKGKALLSHQNLIIFIAVPHIIKPNGQEAPAETLIYTWKKNGSVVDSSSGYGRRTYALISPLVSVPLDIEVEVTSPEDIGVGYARVVVAPVEPSVIFYKKSPLYGIEFQKALTDTVEMGDSKEIAVFGAPFYFGSSEVFGPEMDYRWSVNGKTINDGIQTSTRVFRQKEGVSGTSSISLSVENISKLLQFSSAKFNLKFGN